MERISSSYVHIQEKNCVVLTVCQILFHKVFFSWTQSNHFISQDRKLWLLGSFPPQRKTANFTIHNQGQKFDHKLVLKIFIIIVQLLTKFYPPVNLNRLLYMISEM